jgi:hypothetical protein
MVGTGHNGFLLPVVDWMGWWFATSFWAKEKQETVSDFLLGDAAGGRLVFSSESSGQVGPMIEYYDTLFFLCFFPNNKFMRIKLYRCIITQ